MFLGKPIFSTQNTIVEKKVLNHQMGYISGESGDDIISTIKAINKSDLIAKGEAAKACWLSTYKDYTQNYMKTEYLNL